MAKGGRLWGIGEEGFALSGERVGRLTDEQIDYWGERYLFYCVGELLGVTFETYLRNPRACLDAVCRIVLAQRAARGEAPREAVDAR